MPAWLFALFAGAFVLYTDDYVIAGVLPEIAREFGVGEARAGQLVTVFSVTVALAAPVAGIALARVSRRLLFGVALLIFIGANLAAAVADSFTMLLILRVLAALAAAAATPALFAYAAERAQEGRTGRYVAVVALGVTGSLAAGVPIGTWIGGRFGWHATFLAMAIAGAAALVFLLGTLPDAERAGGVPGLAEQLRVLGSPPVSLGLLANCVLMTGSMMMLTYQASFFAAVSRAGVDQRALAFALSGTAGLAGVWLGGLATDRWGPDRSLRVGIGSFVGTMVVLWGLGFLRPVPLFVIMGIGTLQGGIAFWNAPAIQARLYLLAGPVAGQALALNTSGTYLGVALGGAVGGLTLSWAGAEQLPIVAAVLGAGALVLLGMAARAEAPAATRLRARSGARRPER
ncbi:MFS transporter [Nocardia sp. NPDC050435]|uniref:MFS transporter n=1 Tax=Nocardia sp. NPDC050435 TaxID=3155040 RepID=UPI0033FC9CD4